MREVKRMWAGRMNVDRCREIDSIVKLTSLLEGI